jgi:excisionase family DNA binding protein
MERKEQNHCDIQKLMTAKDVAELLGISVKTVNKQVRAGLLGCVQITSKERRFTQEQVRAYIESKSQPVRVDTTAAKPLFYPGKGGEKSFGVSKADLRKEMSQWR